MIRPTSAEATCYSHKHCRSFTRALQIGHDSSTQQAWAFEGGRNTAVPRAPFPGCEFEDFLCQESRPQVSLARVLVPLRLVRANQYGLEAVTTAPTAPAAARPTPSVVLSIVAVEAAA